MLKPNSKIKSKLKKALLAVSIACGSVTIFAEPINDQNNTIQDVEQKFAAISTYGEWMGYWPGIDSVITAEPIIPKPVPGYTSDQHVQGIARSNGPGTPFIYVARSGASDFAADNLGTVDVIELRSRNGSGERMRSNRLARDKETKNTTPPNSDKVVKTIAFPDYWHPGGMTVIGDVLAVALEGSCQTESENYCPDNISDIPDSVVRFYDIREPSNPIFMYDFVRPIGGTDPGSGVEENPPIVTEDNIEDTVNQRFSRVLENDKLGFVGAVKYQDRHFILVPAASDEYWQFYATTGGKSLSEASESGDWEFYAELNAKEAGFPQPSNAFQNIHFLHQEASASSPEKMFLIASQNTGLGPPFINGSDRLHLLEMNLPDFNNGVINVSTVRIDSKKLSSAGNFVAFLPDGIDVAEGAAGGASGFAAGAAIGSAVPILGTGIGAIIGGIWGGSAGSGIAGFLPGEPDNFAKQEANFNASGAPHITPSGELLYYSAAFYNRGPSGTARFAELAHNRINNEGRCIARDGDLRVEISDFVLKEGQGLLGSASSQQGHPWVELYQDRNFEGRKVTYDWLDRNFENWDDFKRLNGNQAGDPGFSDKASSIRYCLPSDNWNLTLFDDDSYNDPKYNNDPLSANGFVTSQQVLPDGTEDKVTSMLVSCNAGIPEGRYTWEVLNPSSSIDLEVTEIGTGEVAAVEVLNGDISEQSIQVRVSYAPPCGGDTISEIYPVRIINEPPTIQRPRVFDINSRELGKDVNGVAPGLVSVQSIFDDPAGMLDGPYTLLINWGDGSTQEIELDPSDYPASTGIFSHSYEASDENYELVMTITGSDNVSTSSSININVDESYAFLQNDFDSYSFDQFNTATSNINYYFLFNISNNGQTSIGNSGQYEISAGALQYANNDPSRANAAINPAATLKIGQTFSVQGNIGNASIGNGWSVLAIDDPNLSIANGYYFEVTSAQIPFRNLFAHQLNVFEVINGTIVNNSISADVSASTLKTNRLFRLERLKDDSLRVTTGDLNVIIDNADLIKGKAQLYTGVANRQRASWDNWQVKSDSEAFGATAITALGEWQRTTRDFCDFPDPLAATPAADGTMPSGNYVISSTNNLSCTLDSDERNTIFLGKELNIPYLFEDGAGPTISWWQYIDKPSTWDFKLEISRADNQNNGDFIDYVVPQDYPNGWHKVTWPLQFVNGASDASGIGVDLNFSVLPPLDRSDLSQEYLGWLIDDVKIDYGENANLVCDNNVLGDASFEAGNASAFWNATMNELEYAQGGDALTGFYGAKIGTQNNLPERLRLSQIVTMPETEAARLRFYYKIERGCLENCDNSKIEILMNGETVWEIVPRELTNGFAEAFIDMSAFADGGIYEFAVQVDASEVGSIVLEDFCLGQLDSCVLESVALSPSLDGMIFVDETGQRPLTLSSVVNLSGTSLSGEACRITPVEVSYALDGIDIGSSQSIGAGFSYASDLPQTPLNTNGFDEVNAMLTATATMLDTGETVSANKQLTFVHPADVPQLAYSVSPSNTIDDARLGDKPEFVITVVNINEANPAESLQLTKFQSLKAPWEIVSDNCTGTPLASMDMCQFVVAFEAQELGESNTILGLSSTDISQGLTEIMLTVNVSEDALIGDWDKDGDVDLNDVYGLLRALQQRQIVDIEFDINQDNVVNMFDVRALMPLCTRARCAVQ